MIFTIAQETLSHALGITLKGVDPRASIAILTGVLITAKEGQVTFQTANTETSVSHTAPAYINEEGQTVLPAKLFNDIIRSLPGEAIKLESISDGIQIKISCSSSSFTLNAFNPEDFPSFPEISIGKSAVFTVRTIERMVKQVSCALSNEQSRPILTGILLEYEDNKLTMVTTDSYRVAKADDIVVRDDSLNQNDGGKTNKQVSFKVVIPGTTFKDVAFAASGEETILIGYTDNQVIFSFGTTSFITRRIEGNFPNYRRVFPKDSTTSFTVSTDSLIASIKRIRVLVNASPLKNSSIKFSILPDEQALTISANFIDLGRGVERIPAAIEGEALDISFNPGYILDGLSSMAHKEAMAKFTTSTRPGIFSSAASVVEKASDSFVYLVMPVRSN